MLKKQGINSLPIINLRGKEYNYSLGKSKILNRKEYSRNNK